VLLVAGLALVRCLRKDLVSAFTRAFRASQTQGFCFRNIHGAVVVGDGCFETLVALLVVRVIGDAAVEFAVGIDQFLRRRLGGYTLVTDGLGNESIEIVPGSDDVVNASERGEFDRHDRLGAVAARLVMEKFLVVLFECVGAVLRRIDQLVAPDGAVLEIVVIKVCTCIERHGCTAGVTSVFRFRNIRVFRQYLGHLGKFRVDELLDRGGGCYLDHARFGERRVGREERHVAEPCYQAQVGEGAHKTELCKHARLEGLVDIHAILGVERRVDRTQFLVALVPFVREAAVRGIGHTRYDAGFVRRVAAAVHVVRQQVIGEIVVLVPALVVPQVQGRADIVLDCPESFVGIGGRRVLLKAYAADHTEGEDG